MIVVQTGKQLKKEEILKKKPISVSSQQPFRMQ